MKLPGVPLTLTNADDRGQPARGLTCFWRTDKQDILTVTQHFFYTRKHGSFALDLALFEIPVKRWHRNKKMPGFLWLFPGARTRRVGGISLSVLLVHDGVGTDESAPNDTIAN